MEEESKYMFAPRGQIIHVTETAARLMVIRSIGRGYMTGGLTERQKSLHRLKVDSAYRRNLVTRSLHFAVNN